MQNRLRSDIISISKQIMQNNIKAIFFDIDGTLFSHKLNDVPKSTRYALAKLRENDMEMLRFTGIGIAMGNAGDNVKAAADYVTDTVENNGIEKALEHFGLM